MGEDANGMTVTQAIKHLEECFRVLDTAWSMATDRQPRRLSEEGLTVSQAIKLLDRCFEFLNDAWHTASDRHLSVARRFSEEAPGLSLTQALERMDECFEVLEQALLEGKTFSQAWAEHEQGW